MAGLLEGPERRKSYYFKGKRRHIATKDHGTCNNCRQEIRAGEEYYVSRALHLFYSMFGFLRERLFVSYKEHVDCEFWDPFEGEYEKEALEEREAMNSEEESLSDAA